MNSFETVAGLLDYAMTERTQRSTRQSCKIIDATLDPLCGSRPTTSSIGDMPYTYVKRR